MKAREPIPAAAWWRSAGDTFDKVLREFLARAQKAEREQTGHDCGHLWTISVRSTLHATGNLAHTDADWDADMEPVTVRAHNLRDALLIAATLPLSEWFEGEGGER